jgi:polyisoprenoid-binding protein YceI
VKTFSLLILVLSIASCSSRLAPPTAQPLAASTQQADQTNRFTPQNTHVTFIGSALIASHQGTFTQFTGPLNCPDADPPHASFSIEFEMDSVYTEIPLLTKHLKQDDFFDVTKFPRATFTSTQIRRSGASNTDYVIEGNFTLHGITRAMQIPAKIAIEPKAVHIDASFTVRQSDFAMQSARTTTDEVPVTVSAKIAYKTAATGHSDPAP